MPPIRVFYNELDQQFYAASAYRCTPSPNGTTEFVTLTGAKYNVTKDIAKCIIAHQITFTPVTLSLQTHEDVHGST